MHRWNKYRTLSQNHNLPTYLSTDPPTYQISYLLICFFSYLPSSCTYFLISCFLTTHLTYLLTISLKNHPLPFQNHTLPTYLPTHLPIKFPTYLCASFPTSQALVPTFSCPAVSLPTLHTFSLFLSKTTPYLPTYLRACLPPSLVLFPTSLSWLREKAKSR